MALEPFTTDVSWKLAEDRKVGLELAGGNRRPTQRISSMSLLVGIVSAWPKPGTSYHSYVRLFPTKDEPNMYAGNIYVFHDDAIVGMIQTRASLLEGPVLLAN